MESVKTHPLTKYERIHVIGLRSEQLARGALPLVETDPDRMESPYEIAERELKTQRLPMIVTRTLPDDFIHRMLANRTSFSSECHKEFEIRPMQQEAIEWMKKRESSPPYGGILADNVGAGKTFTVAGLLKDAPLWPVLILVPKSLIWQWLEVLNAADLEEEVHVMSTATRDPDREEAADASHAQLVLATHGCLINPPDFLRRSWGRIVVDEAHCAKNPKSITSRNLRSLRAHAKWALTATPVQNCREDLLAIARVVGIVSEDTNLIRDVFTHRFTKGTEPPSNEPRLTFSTVHVPLENEIEKEAYEDANKLLMKAGIDVAKIERSEECDEEEEDAPMSIDPKSRMAILRCRQAATHPAIYYQSVSDSAEKGNHARCVELAKLAQKAREKNSSKIAFLVKDVLAHPDRASVVFCEWSSEMDIVIEALGAAGAKAFSFNGKLSAQDRENVLFFFRRAANASNATNGAGTQPVVLVAQIKCASAGLNLQCASRAYIMRPQWNPAVERQAVGRVHRSGQTRDVHVIRLVGADTIDEMVLQRQRSKLKCITDVMKDDDMERVLNPKTLHPVPNS